MRNKRQIKHRILSDYLKYDPIEDNADMKSVLALASEEAHTELAAQGIIKDKVFGYCHYFWPVKKRILKEKHQVEWQSPGEMNPEMDFD